MIRIFVQRIVLVMSSTNQSYLSMLRLIQVKVNVESNIGFHMQRLAEKTALGVPKKPGCCLQRLSRRLAIGFRDY